MSHDVIEDRFLDNRDLFALRYSQGLVFLEVEEFEDTEYEEFSNLEDISSGSNLSNGYQRLEDSNSDDLLFVPSDDENTILHVGIGIAPSVIEMFVSYPEGSRNMRSIPDLSTPPTPGSNFGHVDGSKSPYRQPTSHSELVIPPKQRISVDFQNPGNDSHEPLLKLVYRKYNVSVLDPQSGVDKNVIDRIVNPGSPAPIFTVGNFDSKADYNMEDEWGVNPRSRSRIRGSSSRGGRE